MATVGRGTWWIVACLACGGAAPQAANADRLAEICRTTTNMGDGVCACVGDRARSELSEQALAFLVASMDKQEEAAEALKKELTLQEITTAGMFFATAPAACAGAPKGGA
ncbi:MAG: hypothetical protein IPK85_22305 [Gemmatimonadetes bacterium]|nr:hypothetical protein [Gemmatimonadota bacterium]